MSAIGNKRVPLEKVQKFVRKNDPTLEEMIGVMDALGTVFGDFLGCPVEVKAKITPPPMEAL